jgi:hypothetical protein
VTARALITLLAVTASVSCSKPDQPTDPVWSKEPCAHCAMVVGDRRYAAQAVADGDRRWFDDVGCMVLWEDARKTKPTHRWVRDAEAGGWLDARVARYVAGAKTPMDFGFEGRKTGGVSFDEMRDLVLAKEKNR